MANHTFQEIQSQPLVWSQAADVLTHQHDRIQQFWNAGSYDSLIFVGCGSTYYLASAAAELAQIHLGIAARAIPGSALLLYPDAVLTRTGRPLLVTISRSGTTTETIQAARIFRSRYGDHVLAISCYADRPLNAEATLTVAVPQAQEQSLAQTRSFSSMLLLVEGVIRAFGGQPAGHVQVDTEASARLLAQAHDFAESLADPARYERYYFLGSGPCYGLACEAMIKMTEMAQTITHAFHTLEIRHGPMSMVDSRTVVVGLLDGRGSELERKVLEDMGRLGAKCVSIGPFADADLVLPDSASLVYYLPPVQWMAYHRSIQKNLHPDQPRNLVMSIEL